MRFAVFLTRSFVFFVSGVFFVPVLYDNNLITVTFLNPLANFQTFYLHTFKKTLKNSCVPQKLSAEHLSYDIELETAVKYLTVFVFL